MNKNNQRGSRMALKPQLDEVRMVSVSGILGYGFPEKSLELALAKKPHMIGVDGGISFFLRF
jgi:hypothetical protein